MALGDIRMRKEFQKIRCATVSLMLFAAVPLPSMAASDFAPVSVSLCDLIKHADQFNGKVVSVRGTFETDGIEYRYIHVGRCGVRLKRPRLDPTRERRECQDLSKGVTESILTGGGAYLCGPVRAKVTIIGVYTWSGPQDGTGFLEAKSVKDAVQE